MTQRLVRLLPADVDQLLAQLAECLHRYAAAVDVAARAAVRGNDPPQDAVVVLVEVVFAEPRAEVGAIANVERGRYLAAIRAGPNRFAVRAFAQCERERVDEDRFARAGLAG